MKKRPEQVNDKSGKAWLKLVLCLWCFAFIVLFAKNSDATEHSTKSIHIAEGKVAELAKLQDSQFGIKKSPLITRETVLTRDAYLAQKQAKVPLSKSKLVANISARSMIHEFSIFDGYSQLFDDFDGDGFYQTFSITFDADVETYGGHDDAYVYAEIYLSRNGGPWEYFYTTENFVIYGNSSDDAYEVLSNLDTGYPSDYYDVLIDLYEVGYQGIVASYSSDDNSSLYALALESDDYDQDDYYEYHVHGGSAGIVSLVLLLMVAGYRKYQASNI